VTWRGRRAREESRPRLSRKRDCHGAGRFHVRAEPPWGRPEKKSPLFSERALRGVPNRSELEPGGGVPHRLERASEDGGLDSRCRFIGS